MKLRKLTNNFHKISTARYDVWVSYETTIAFHFWGGVFIVKNKWGTTTGKHINRIKEEYPVHTVVESEEKLLSIIEDHI